MHDCYRRIGSLFHEQQRHGFTHNHTATEHDDVCAGDRHVGFAEQTQTTEGSAGYETGIIAHRQLRYVKRVESIDILARIESTNDYRLINLWRRRRLHEDAVNCRITVQFFNPGE